MIANVFEKINKIKSTENDYRLIFLVILLGFVIRLFVCQYTYIINSDGVLYIHQARAIYYQNYETIYQCGVDYFSVYPILIALFFPFTGDFLFAAIAVSCLFGTMTLIPIFFLMRRFFSVKTSSIVTLIYAMLPVFVARSADVLRGPICWFFLAWGILSFIQYIDHKRFVYFLISIACFIFATWARIEAVLSFPSILLYLFILSKNKKKILINSIVLGVFIVIVAICLKWTWGLPINKVYRIEEITHKFIGPYKKYDNLRKILKEKSHKDRFGFFDNFLINARHQIHFVAFGALISNAFEAYFYPFFLFFIVGFFQTRIKIKEDPRLWFFILMSLSGVFIVFIHIIQYWMIEYRYFALVIISTSVFAGFGIESCKIYLSKKLNLSYESAIIFICIFIILFGLGKNLRPREKDKYIYRLMGENIAQIEKNNLPVSVASIMNSTVCEKVHFYANRSFEGVLCPRQRINFTALSENNYKSFIEQLKKYNAEYFLWEKRLWPENWFDFRKCVQKNDFFPIMRYKRSNEDYLILYKAGLE